MADGWHINHNNNRQPPPPPQQQQQQLLLLPKTEKKKHYSLAYAPKICSGRYMAELPVSTSATSGFGCRLVVGFVDVFLMCCGESLKSVSRRSAAGFLMCSYIGSTTSSTNNNTTTTTTTTTTTSTGRGRSKPGAHTHTHTYTHTHTHTHSLSLSLSLSRTGLPTAAARRRARKEGGLRFVTRLVVVVIVLCWGGRFSGEHS